MSSERFLSRWSRRKREPRAAEQPVIEQPIDDGQATPMQPDSAAADCAAEPAGGMPIETELSADEIARLPALDELTADTDLSPFLRMGVPQALRNAALRRMWSLDPSIRDFVSEAREYAYDWNVPGGVPGFGGAMPPADEIRKLAEQIVGGRSPSEPQAAPERDVSSAPRDHGAASPEHDPVEGVVTAGAETGQPDLSVPEEPHAPETPAQKAATTAVDPQQPDPVRSDDPDGRSGPFRRRHGGATPC